MNDFTFEIFIKILRSLKNNGYQIFPFIQTINQDFEVKRLLILRHDVDRFPNQALKMANLEAKNGIKSTYYFRTIPTVYKSKVIEEICLLGHEIGYHYEDLTFCRGNISDAIKHFEDNLKKLRTFYPVQTICMHGSPLSKWDNKIIWQYYNYKDWGIIGDTSFDIDYNKVFYITDNGRAWNRTNVSIRDKVETNFKIPINSSFHLIKLIENGVLPNHLMINAHPDTFFDFGINYFLNMGYIELKNVAKWVIVKYGLRK